MSAERQLMELLECDDFKPYKTPPKSISIRPHTTVNTPQKPKSPLVKIKKVSKSAEKAHKINITKTAAKHKRASVIDPPSDFKDENLIDSFELIENYINQNFGEDSLTSDIDFEHLCSDNKNNINNHFTQKKDRENFSLSTILNESKYSDDTSIDPRLINENDNLTIPDNFDTNESSPTSINDNPEIDHYSAKYDKKISALESEIGKNAHKRSVSVDHNDHKSAEEIQLDEFISSLDDLENFTQTELKRSKLPKKNNDKSTISLNSSTSNDRKKNLSSLKRSISLLDPVLKPKSLKNKKDVENYFEEQEQRNPKKEVSKYKFHFLNITINYPLMIFAPSRGNCEETKMH